MSERSIRRFALEWIIDSMLILAFLARNCAGVLGRVRAPFVDSDQKDVDFVSRDLSPVTAAWDFGLQLGYFVVNRSTRSIYEPKVS